MGWKEINQKNMWPSSGHHKKQMQNHSKDKNLKSKKSTTWQQACFHVEPSSG